METKGTNDQNDNFFYLSRICMQFFSVEFLLNIHVSCMATYLL